MKNIPIFISSTFSDMHQERDLLQQVAGLINLNIAHKGYRITLKDLRYGIDTSVMEDEREIERKILGECFDAIEECALFVLLLGDRYGSVFEDLTVPLTYMPGMDLKGKSVTHLEVEYGILRIGKERMLVLEREFEGDSASLPPHYRESEEGTERNLALKAQLREENYLMSGYQAEMGKNGLQVDEMTFLRYAWGFLTTLVENFIAEDDDRELLLREEVLSGELAQAVEKKAAQYPAPLWAAARGLLLLRIQELLHLEDYDAINRLGGSGKAILQYRSALVRDLPSDFTGLVKEVCLCISRVMPSGPDTFGALEALALGQGTSLARIGGIGAQQLEIILMGQGMPQTTLFSQWEETLERIGGSGTSKLPRALSYFQNTLLVHSEDGYLFADPKVAETIRASCGEEIREKFLCYLASVFWYLPQPGEIWMDFLTRQRYDLCVKCMDFVHLDDRASYEIDTYVEENGLSEAFFPMAEDFGNWLIPQRGKERHLMWLQGLARGLAYGMDEEDCYEHYQSIFSPWLKRLHDRFYETHKEDLSDVRIFLLDEMYNDFTVDMPQPPASVLTQAQMERLYELRGESCTSGWEEEDDCPTDEEVTDGTIDTLLSRDYTPEKLAEVLRADVVYMDICRILHRIVLEDAVWDKKEIPILLEAKLYLLDYSLCTFMEDAVTYLIRPLLEEGCYDLCARILWILYETVQAEERLRRCPWYRWLRRLPYELVWEIARETQDEVAWQIKSLYDEVGFEDLEELDEELLEQAENRYRK